MGTERDVELFMTSLEETLGPLERPRYVMPRYVQMARDNVLSRLLPEVVGRYFRTRRKTMAMLHAVPTALGRNKDLAAIYAKHWNEHVSPGEPVYAQHGKGERLLLKGAPQRARAEPCPAPPGRLPMSASPACAHPRRRRPSNYARRGGRDFARMGKIDAG